MLHALIHGKLSREQENMEDILTSVVFGTLKLIDDPNLLLMPFLLEARDLKNQTLPEPFKLIESNRPDISFWERLNESDCNGCEPDVLIRLNVTNGLKLLILIEAKFRSGKSSLADSGETSQKEINELEEQELAKVTDQLAREWTNLNKLADRESRMPCLIYLTAHIAIPIHDIKESQAELARKNHGYGNIFWLSWRHLESQLRDKAELLSIHPLFDAIEDLAACLRRLRLVFFSASVKVGAFPRFLWRFGSTSRNGLNWSTLLVDTKWRFKTLHSGNQGLRWKISSLKTMKWRFSACQKMARTSTS